MLLTIRLPELRLAVRVACMTASIAFIQCGGASTGNAPSDGAGSSRGGTQSSSSGTGGSGLQPGLGGSGGEAPAPGMSVGEGCESPGELACAGHHQKLKLICGKERTWESNGTCGAGEFCQTATTVDLGVCLQEAEECRGLEPGAKTCKESALRECGPDSLDSVLLDACKYGCADGECRAAALCEEGAADCDDAPDCETDTTRAAQHCGACGNACSAQPHTSGLCVDGDCSCAQGYADCSSAAGCETATDIDEQNCGECGKVCASGECVNGHCTSRVFVTSVSFDGNLGGLVGADEKCQALADAEKLGGMFRAWLSDSSTDVQARFPHSPAPYRQLDGSVIADDWAGLALTLKKPITIDETGSELDPDIERVWTGTGGKSYGPYYCEDWTSASTPDRGLVGNPRSGLGWQEAGWNDCFYVPGALYCFEVNAAN